MLPPNLPSDISQKRLTRAFEKAGFILNVTGGKGGHYKLIDPKTKRFITLQSNVFKQVLRDKLKQAEEMGYDATKIMNGY